MLKRSDFHDYQEKQMRGARVMDSKQICTNENGHLIESGESNCTHCGILIDEGREGQLPKQIERPTVLDIIKELQKLPKDLPFIIIDPDTGWTIDIIHIKSDDKFVSFTGEYPEMTDDDDA